MKTEFDSQALEYSNYRPKYPEELFDFLTAATPVHECAFDVGTGNGQCAVSLARHFNKVFASDLSDDQLRHAFPLKNINYFVSEAHDSRLIDRSVDLITVATALHWFDFEKFFKEVDRVLKPNGIFAAWSYGWHQTENVEVNSLFNRIGKEILANYWSPQPKLIWNEYRDIAIPFTQISAPDFFSETEWDLNEFKGYLSTWSATQKFIKTVGQHPVEQIQKELELAWPDESKKIKFKTKLVLKISKKV